MNDQESYFELCPHDKQNPYVMISREMAQDKSISPKAKGVLLYLLSLPRDWKIYHSQLQDGLGVGEQYINSAMDELVKVGYADRTRERVKGIFQPYKYKIREFKKLLPDRENQPGFSGPENPGLQNTYIKNTDIQKKQQQALPVSAAVSFKHANKEQQIPSIHPILEKVDIPIKDKEWITRNHAEELVIHAVKWATHPDTKIKSTLAAAIKWACEMQPVLPESKENVEQVNKAYALRYDGMKSKNGNTVIAGSTYVEISNSQCPNGTPFYLNYDSKGFRNQFESALRKNNFTILKE